MTPTIRRATETDIPAITAIYNHAVEHSSATYDHLPVTVEHRLRWFEERQAAGLPVLVAASGAEVLGWASYGPYRPRLGYSRTAEHSVYLAPEARGRRLGGQLLGSIITLATEAGIHTLVGVIGADNEASLRLHRRYGFSEAGRLPEVGHKFGRWLDIVLMTRRLNEDAPPPHGQS